MEIRVGGHSMLNKGTIAFLAAALVLAGFPASAFDLPDYGSKNFSPASDTPTYFANETAPVSARIADTTDNDWSEVEAAAPVASAAAAAWPRASSGRHGRYEHRSAFGKPRGF